MQFLNLSEDYFLSVVLFIGNTEFKTDMPDNVLNGGLLRWIQSHTEPRLVTPTVDQVVSQLSNLDCTTDRRRAAREHLKALRARHGISLSLCHRHSQHGFFRMRLCYILGLLQNLS